MPENDKRAVSAATAKIGIVFWLCGVPLIGRSGALGLVGWVLVLFGVAALAQAALVRRGRYEPNGWRTRNDEPQRRS